MQLAAWGEDAQNLLQHRALLLGIQVVKEQARYHAVYSVIGQRDLGGVGLKKMDIDAGTLRLGSRNIEDRRVRIQANDIDARVALLEPDGHGARAAANIENGTARQDIGRGQQVLLHTTLTCRHAHDRVVETCQRGKPQRGDVVISQGGPPGQRQSVRDQNLSPARGLQSACPVHSENRFRSPGGCPPGARW